MITTQGIRIPTHTSEITFSRWVDFQYEDVKFLALDDCEGMMYVVEGKVPEPFELYLLTLSLHNVEQNEFVLTNTFSGVYKRSEKITLGQYVTYLDSWDLFNAQ